MAILTTSNLISEQRYDISDARRVESGVRNDFDELVTGIWTNTQQGYIVRGFTILTAGAQGSPANGLQMVVDPGSVLNINASVSGTIFQVPEGTPNQTLNAATNTNVSGSFTANSTNYVGIDYNRFADPTTNVTKFIWSAAANDEIETIAPAAQTLTYKIYITTSVWALNVLPVAIVTTDGNGNVTSITDARWLLCSLETGGLNPNPKYVYPWTEGRTPPPVTTTSDSIDPFVGGDKQLSCVKDWMNAVMTTFLEIKGTPFWTSGGGSFPIPSLVSLFQDLGNTVITGSGEISNGILPNSDPLLVTTGNITVSSNQLTTLGSTAGLVLGDYIFGLGIPAGTTITAIAGSTITMSNTATVNGTGITVTFYSPSVITAPGQINWNDPIYIRVIGSSLTYELAANPTSTNISLSDDQVAYVTLIRDQPITPNLIFNSGSPVVASVGAVSWTTGLLAGDYVKIASNTVSDYYQILSVNSLSQVTLTANVTLADNTGAVGAQAQYAFGSYSTAATPTTTRNIYISSRETVPVSANVFWLFIREDNGGAPKVYIRFLSQELDNGESVSISGTTSLELLKYIGAATASSSLPQYVSALNPGSIPEIATITTGSGATITGGQYFLIASSNTARYYAAWFKVNGVGSAPSVPDATATIEIDILNTDSANTVASEIAAALNGTQFDDFTAVATTNTVMVTNNSAGVTTASSNGTVGAPFAIVVNQVGTGTGNNIINDGDSLTLAIKKLDEAIGELEALLAYDEVVEIVASGAVPPSSLNGPIANGVNITLPNNSREGNIAQTYVVGKGTLQVFLNGQFLDVESGAYEEIGPSGMPSSQIAFLTLPGGGLVVGDEIEFRIAASGGSGGGEPGPPGAPGATGAPGADAIGGPIAISTKTSSYTVLTTDCVLLADCTGGNIIFTLPTAASSNSKVKYFKKIDTTPNYMTVQAAGGDLIDGSSSQFTNTLNFTYMIVSNGTNWYIL